MRATVALVRLLTAFTVLAAGVTANDVWAFGTPTPTLKPTPTPPPAATHTARGSGGGGSGSSCPAPNANKSCAGVAKLQLRWSVKDPLAVQVLLTATQCANPTRCAGSPDSGLITSGPFTLSVTDSAGRTLSGSVTASGTNTGGCPGSDNFRGTADRMRLIFGTGTTVIGRVRAPVDQPSPGSMIPPMRYKLRDACGYTLEGTVSTCFLNQNATTARIKCL